MKRVIVGLALLLTLTTLIAEPLTPAEAWDYIKSKPREAAADIVTLDAIENADPVVSAPQLVVIVLQDGSARAYWTPAPVLTVDIAGKLRYEIALPEATAPASGGRLPWMALGIGAAAGSLITLVIGLAF